MSNGYPNSTSPLGGSPSPGPSPGLGSHHHNHNHKCKRDSTKNTNFINSQIIFNQFFAVDGSIENRNIYPF